MNKFQVIIAAYSVKNAQFNTVSICSLQATTTDIKIIFGFSVINIISL